MTNHHVRFAPSPTGDLHLGHAYSALYSWHAAKQNAGFFQLRIDDLDHTRCKDVFCQRQIDDLHWLGLSWDRPPLYQSARLHRYRSALEFLQQQDLVYPCLLSRKEVDEILSAPQESASLRGALTKDDEQARIAKGTMPAWRLDIGKIKQMTPALYWFDAQKGRQQVDMDSLRDSIIARRDIGASYDLSVVLDDYDSGISLVTRGADLFAQTSLHRLLQQLLSLPSPLYDHHALIRDEDGKRLAKRDDAKSLTIYRENGATLEDIKALLPPLS